MYLPDAGHGFLSDDFGWILSAEAFLRAPSPVALAYTTGFFRPVVTLSFVLNVWLFGHAAYLFALTNIALTLTCALLLYVLCRSLVLSPFAALVASGAWLFNFHGINMAIMWISGRTSLLLTLFALAAAIAATRQRPWWAALWCTAAMLSKEEAIALPVVLFMWMGIRASWPSLLSLAPYFWLRAQSDALWPANAPAYYRFTSDAGAMLTNAVHYLDRAGTVFVVAGIVVGIATYTTAQSRPLLNRSIVVKAVAWFAGAYAITMWLPVRSSLYAVFPSVGAALLLAAFADTAYRAADGPARRRAASVLLVLPFLLWPIYHARNGRWRHAADLTTSVRRDLPQHLAAFRAGPVWIVDDSSTRANIRNAFAGLLPDAIELDAGFRPADVQVASDVSEAPPGATVFMLRGGQLVPRAGATTP